jgi:hypothetical protein
MFCEYDIIGMVNNAPTVSIKPFMVVKFDKDELNRIVDERVIEPIKNGELVVKREEGPKGEWIPTVIDTGFFERSVCKEWKCSNCGEVVNIKYPFCHCGADMRKEAEK